jgi:hypothetical protein
MTDRHERSLAFRQPGESVMSESVSASEPPSQRSAAPSRFFRIGKDSRGRWVVQDQSGLCGGLFINRSEAVKFAMFENGNRPQAVVMVPDVLELDMSARPNPRPSTMGQKPLARAA